VQNFDYLVFVKFEKTKILSSQKMNELYEISFVDFSELNVFYCNGVNVYRDIL